ncbi:Maf family protein [Paenibacillus sp. GYB003]|uniref:Maf family protein n=1 Tax=Paenibacillus sp. GYB003 TaxID=2994392 RepID=UPI002F96349C
MSLQQRFNRGEVIEFGKPTLVLASASSRRTKQLAKFGLDFVQIVSTFDDSSVNYNFPHTGVSIDQAKSYSATMALEKLKPFIEKIKNGAVVAADTIIFCSGRIIEKPITKERCREQHEFISGKTVSRCNALAVYYDGRTLSEVTIGDVLIAPLPKQVIEEIANESETLNCAGYNRGGAIAPYVLTDAPRTGGIEVPVVLDLLSKLGFAQEQASQQS